MKTAGIIAEYNPFHNGHRHVALAALRFCDTLHICVAADPAKPEPEWRVRMGFTTVKSQPT